VLAAVGLVAAMAGLVRPPRIGAPVWQAALVLGPAVFLLAGLGRRDAWRGLPDAAAGHRQTR
jgi:hypothetical protein